MKNAVAAAHKAFKPSRRWRTIGASQRGHLLYELADLFASVNTGVKLIVLYALYTTPYSINIAQCTTSLLLYLTSLHSQSTPSSSSSNRSTPSNQSTQPHIMTRAQCQPTRSHCHSSFHITRLHRSLCHHHLINAVSHVHH